MQNKEKITLGILFFLSTIYLLYQHYTDFSWDFNAYVLNARYLFENGIYFEHYRPILMPLILGILGEYLYIIFVSLLLLYSTIKISDALKINKLYFYVLTLNIYVLINGFINGTEVLSFALLELGIAYIITNKYSGIPFGLSFLSRYNIMSLFPLIFFHKNVKKIVINFILLFLTILPFLIYDYYTTGNAFTSIGDSYALNVHFRENVINWNVMFIQLLAVGNVLWVFFFLGIFSNFKIKTKEFWIMVFIFLVTLYGYIKTPVKDIRYLFNLTLPIVYFSYYGVKYIEEKFKIKRVLLFIFILNLLFVFNYEINSGRENKEVYLEAVNKINELNLSNCQIYSNGWVMVNYLGLKSKFSPREQLVNYYLERNATMLFFYHIGEPDYVSKGLAPFTNPLNIAYNNSKFVILSKGCGKIENVDKTYLYELNQTLYLTANKSISVNPCDYLFKGFLRKLFLTIC